MGGTQTSYVYDVNASLPVLLDDGTHKYVWGLGLAFAVDQAGNPFVYHTDGLGSIRALTDANGNVVQTYQYDEYGNVVSSSGSIIQPFQYTGEQRDEMGFMYLRARRYDPASGRFIQGDPVLGFQEVPASLDRYAYAVDNPVSLTDPSGLVIPPSIIKPCRGGIKGDTGGQCTDSVSAGLAIMGVVNPVGIPVSVSRLGEAQAFVKTLEHALNPEQFLLDIATKYGINLRGVRIVFDPELGAGTLGVTRQREGGRIIRIGSDALSSVENAANTIAHELSHARDYLQGVARPGEDKARFAGDALESWIRGLR